MHFTHFQWCALFMLSMHWVVYEIKFWSDTKILFCRILPYFLCLYRIYSKLLLKLNKILLFVLNEFLLA